ncbi:MAG: methyl-accepting chemotaxis protein [Lachnospiraceae bacterium]|nr:methyl-accepting chemotaxis protein [Lachnospiraceae bacterium]
MADSKENIRKKRTGLGLKAKMLLGIIPVVLVGLVIVTFVSTSQAGGEINSLTEEKASEMLDGNISSINSTLQEFRTTALTLSRTVGATYGSTDLATYEEVFSKVVADNDSVLGSGIWFEPGVYQGQEFAGPYWTKDSAGKVYYTDEYSNAEYNYPAQEYYTNAKAMKTMDAVITDPYYDPSSGHIMATCSAPIFNGDGDYVGCITVDTELTQIQEIVSGMKLGQDSEAMLLDSQGFFLYDKDDSKMDGSCTIANDSNASLAAVSSTVMGSESGVTAYKVNGASYEIFFATVPEVNWKLLITLRESEMKSATNRIGTISTVICIIAILICGIIILFLVSNISKSVDRVKKFAGELAKGDFTVDKIKNRSNDELGQMSESLNDMYESNRSVIGQVSEESVKISEASSSLSGMADQLSTDFEQIRSNMSGVNDAMMSASAATEEINASVEEVNASVQLLSAETNETKQKAMDIQERAKQIEKNSRIAYDNALSAADAREADVKEANEKAAIVNQIGSLADSIANIADQINLLSLNASIEAARAGEHGKGFAVVASEINKLALDTAEAVEQIQGTIGEVQGAFSGLLDSTNQLLTFMTTTVSNDYNDFINMANQYGTDAASFGEESEKIAEMVQTIREAMGEVSDAIQNIAESTQETAERSTNVADTVENVGYVVDNVTDMSGKQNTIAASLTEVVGKFKLR